jgi:folate-binding protein YgfZ
MNKDWLDYLGQQHLAADGESFGNPTEELKAARDGTVVVPLVDFATIRAVGEDAASFLHNLVTNDVQNLASGSVRFAGFCTPKGRLLATFHIWRDGPDLLLALSADIQPAILKKLSMYVLRSKVRLADADLALVGLAGPGAKALAEKFQGLPLGGERYLLALPPNVAISAWPALISTAAPAGTAAWRCLEIAAGQPRVVASTQEAFVPQMVNMELPAVAGVSFTKGCYPGQEIVARTQYLGKVKRRMYRARLDAGAAPGTDLFTPEAGEQHCGAVVTVAPSANGGYDCLLVVQSSGAEAGEIHIGSPSGPRATLTEQPYVID